MESRSPAQRLADAASPSRDSARERYVRAARLVSPEPGEQAPGNLFAVGEVGRPFEVAFFCVDADDLPGDCDCVDGGVPGGGALQEVAEASNHVGRVEGVADCRVS